MRVIERDIHTYDDEPLEAQGETRHVRVAVIGAGFAGLSVAYNLRRAGITDFVVLERAHSVGGVWRDNTYPGAACDVPSHLYSLSFAPNPDWKRAFSRGGPICEYLQSVADDHELTPFIRFGEELFDARWDEDAQRWRLSSTTLELTADVLVSGAGPLTEPVFPDVPGLDRFRGRIFHSARWDHDHNLTGERIAVVGSGASAVQIVPEIQARAGKLLVFQRTPAWVVRRFDREVSKLERQVLRRFPFLIRALRGWQLAIRDGLMHPMIRRRPLARLVTGVMARAHLRRQVRDPQLRRDLTPDFEVGCKRVLISNDWYPALSAPNVTLVPSALQAISETSVTDGAGVEHEVDTIVFATGFETTGSPIFSRIHGRDGRSLDGAWQGQPRFVRGTTVAGFPNFFMLAGSGSGLGHGSMVWQIEAQTAYLMDALRVMDEHELGSVDVTTKAQDAYMEWVAAELRETVWVKGGCQSWYLDDGGVPSFLWPGTMLSFKKMLARFDVESYAVRAARPAVAAAAAR